MFVEKKKKITDSLIRKSKNIWNGKQLQLFNIWRANEIKLLKTLWNKVYHSIYGHLNSLWRKIDRSLHVVTRCIQSFLIHILQEKYNGILLIYR